MLNLRVLLAAFTTGVMAFAMDPLEYQTSAGKMTFDEENYLVSLEVNDNTWNYFQNNGFDGSEMNRKVTKAVYEVFQDEFDFIFLVSNTASEDPRNTKYAGRHIGVQNNVKGLGKPVFDYSSNWGSAGRLQSVMHLVARTYIKEGPFLHELAHRWGNSFLPTKLRSHMGDACVGKEYGGQLGGCSLNHLKELGGNRYELSNGRKNSTSFHGISNGGNGVPYSELELYLMGFLDKAEVPTLVAFEGLSRQGNWPNFIYYANSKKEYTVDQLAETHGRRNPSVQSSQKKFRALTVLLSKATPTKSQWEVVRKTVKDMEAKEEATTEDYNFWAATGGRAELKMSGVSNYRIGVELPSSSSEASASSSSSKYSSSSQGGVASLDYGHHVCFVISFREGQIFIANDEQETLRVQVFNMIGDLLKDQTLTFDGLGPKSLSLESQLAKQKLLIRIERENGHLHTEVLNQSDFAN